jgi:AraC-like DNA-binding protein
MLLLRALPNLACTPENAAFRRYFYSKWGRETCIISARTRHGEYPPYTQRLSIKAAWGGTERYYLDGRTVGVDDDNYLALNDLRHYGSLLSSREEVHSFSIFFRPGFAEETLAGLRTSVDGSLETGPVTVRAPVELAEALRPHDELVTPALRRTAEEVDRGNDDPLWYEEQLTELLARLFHAERTARCRTDALALARRGTRQEIAKRIARSVDLIHTNYDRALTVGELAAAAYLSPFHFIRLFRLVNGLTPSAYLRRKRVAVARRLLATSSLRQDEIARRAGFGHRSTMFRQLVSWTGRSARQLRRSRGALR